MEIIAVSSGMFVLFMVFITAILITRESIRYYSKRNAKLRAEYPATITAVRTVGEDGVMHSSDVITLTVVFAGGLGEKSFTGIVGSSELTWSEARKWTKSMRLEFFYRNQNGGFPAPYSGAY